MFKIIVPLILGLSLLTACQSEKKEKLETKNKTISTFDLGKSLFYGKGKCYTCHKIDKKSIGPAVLDIVKIYKEKNADIMAFLKQQQDPIVDPETYPVMKTNFAILKTFSEEELKAIALYMTEVSK